MFQPSKISDFLGDLGQVPVKADPFSLDALIAWLRTKDKSTGYCFVSTNDCLWAHYTLDNGGDIRPIQEGGRRHFVIGPASVQCAGPSFSGSWRSDVAQADSRTYGGALMLALAIKAGAK